MVLPLAGGLGLAVASGPDIGADGGRRRNLGPRPMALVGRLAGHGRGILSESAVASSVVELHELPVPVLWNEDVMGEEKDVGTVTARREQARVVVPGPGRDQLNVAFIPLVDVTVAV
jgi:hypothetical protein